MLRLWNIWSLWGDHSDLEVHVWASSPELARETAHRQGVGWGYGFNPTFQGLHAQPVNTCDGCDGVSEPPVAGSYNASIVLPTHAYVVTHHDGTSEPVRYCDGCAELARCDWNGETAAIRSEGQS